MCVRERERERDRETERERENYREENGEMGGGKRGRTGRERVNQQIFLVLGISSLKIRVFNH